MKNNKYIGITIGPIYKTIKIAQKTREIWGASYLFSYICKEILKNISAEKYNILLPNNEYVRQSKPGVGLYPDRILLRIKENGNFEEINEIIEKVKESVANQLWDELNKSKFTFKPYDKHIQIFKKNKNKIKAFFYNYFKVYAIEADEADLSFVDKNNKKIGIVKSLNLYLDNAEQIPTLAHFDPNPFYVLFHFINHSFLIKDAFHDDYKNGFPSLTEIATNELQFVTDENQKYIAQDEIRKIIKDEFNDKQENDASKPNALVEEIKKDDNALSEIFGIKEISEYLRTYHKYIAIIHADGDNMGKLIGSLETEDEINNFSKDLIEFSIKANEILAGKRFTQNDVTDWGYGAAPIYIGGDDLVFFAPVASRDRDGNYLTLFDLIDKLDRAFDDIFNKKDENNNYEKYKGMTENRPCLTYGISITYYKFPLREAYELSKNLMYEVKNDKYKTRNRIHFKLQKHSKQEYTGIIDKNYNTFSKYRELLNSNLKTPKGKDSDLFINSIYQKILLNRGQYLDTNVKDLTALFDETFNEKVHKDFVEYLIKVREFIEQMFSNQGYNEETLNTIVSLLKLIHFYRDNEFRN
ncbi:MAG: type III-B CRISPR-associated protein Cas10/Cmr2 [Chlorobi bacterium]|nr:type III-B CRISPR-associated protein Cas10/Cmr2 [Chlorobiota bacterium]